MEIDKKVYENIAKEIHSDESPVGIDAKKTHILILDKLIKLEAGLKSIQEDIELLKKSIK